MNDFHGAATEHIAGAHDQRVAQGSGFLQRFGFGARRGVGRLAQAQRVQQLLETLAVFRCVDHVRAGTNDGHAGGFEAECELQRRLAAILHDHTQRFFLVHNLQHIFQRERLEVQAVAGVVVGRHGFGIAVDHDGFVTILAHGERRVHAAVVKLDALADAVGTATEHHDLLVVGRLGLALTVAVAFVRGIQVGGVGGELGRASVHTLVDGAYVLGNTALAHGLVVRLEQLGQAAV